MNLGLNALRFAVTALVVALAPRSAQPPQQQAGVSFSQARAVIVQRCVPCHSQQPTQPGFTSPPNGVTFDTPDQIGARASQIYEQAVVTKNMPLGNLTGITQEQRDLLAVAGGEHDLLAAGVDALHGAGDLTRLRLAGAAEDASEVAELRAGAREHERGGKRHGAT